MSAFSVFIYVTFEFLIKLLLIFCWAKLLISQDVIFVRPACVGNFWIFDEGWKVHMIKIFFQFNRTFNPSKISEMQRVTSWTDIALLIPRGLQVFLTFRRDSRLEKINIKLKIWYSRCLDKKLISLSRRQIRKIFFYWIFSLKDNKLLFLVFLSSLKSQDQT